MSMRALIVALALSPSLAFVSPAEAVHTHMTFNFAQMVAADYWAKRGVTVPCHPQVRLLSWKKTRGWLTNSPIAGGAAPEMLATPELCLIEVTPWAESWRTDSDPELRADYCWDIAHEVGHLAGLEHVHDGSSVMDPDGAPYPFGCEHPRKFLRRRARIARNQVSRPRACDPWRSRCPKSP